MVSAALVAAVPSSMDDTSIKEKNAGCWEVKKNAMTAKEEGKEENSGN